MSGKKPLPSPMSPPSVKSHSERSRRPSTSSSVAAAVLQVDKEHLAQALDKIHTSSKEEGVLTTFNDLAPPPESVTATESKGFSGDSVQHGFSGLYSRFKEAVGVSGNDRDKPANGASGKDRDKPPTAKVPENLDLPLADPASASRRSQSTAPDKSRNSVTSLPRVDTTISDLANKSSVAEPTEPSVAILSGVSASENQAQQYLTAKAPSTGNVASVPSSKSASSSRQSIPHLIKPASSIATANVSNVSVFRDASRPGSSRTEEGSSRSSRRISIPKGDDGPAVKSPVHGKPMGPSELEKSSASGRSRRDDAYSADGSTDSTVSPAKSPLIAIPGTTFPHAAVSNSSLLNVETRPTARSTSRRPAVIDRIDRSRVSESNSRSSSISRGTAEPSPVNTSAHNSVYHASFSHANKHERMKSGDYRIPGTTVDEGAPTEVVSAKLESMRKQVLSKQFWMADETCKECFLCGNLFSAFRRKHHCRTCGCIFDSGCTSLISGEPFGVQGTLRVCKTCLGIISQRQDGNLSDESADDTYLPAIFRPNQPKIVLPSPLMRHGRDDLGSERADDNNADSRSMTTPMMAIPATRRIGESSNRNSAVLEIDSPQLSRPSSSRSLRSINAQRPQSSGHRRQLSKHNIWNRLKPLPSERVPFRTSASEEAAKRPGLPAFHDDNVIDPDLAQYMSDESSDDEEMSIMGTITGNDQHSISGEHERSNFGPYLGAGRRIRTRTQAEKSISGFSYTSRGMDEYYPRSTRRRNMSTTSGHQLHIMRSPRPKTATIKGPSNSTETLPYFESGTSSARLTRSSSMKGEKEPRLELNPASMMHVRKLLRQLLMDADIHNVAAWEKALIPILLKCTSSVDPDIDGGDDIDIRHYVKLKKIPGGRPSDTTYVPGVIFTKKLALKTMRRRMSSPRVVIVSFPIEYQRHQHHFMSLQPVIEQEREFLKQLVNRIVALRPQLLLTEKSVSGLALQYLSEARIAVAYNVKQSVLSAVSRCLETEVISSVDMLALPPNQFQTGKSTGFEVKTFVNDEIPGGKKTYIFLSSNQEELGCTIALRGAPTSTLAKLKHITEFMVYVVYNLKLESSLMRDSLIQLPTTEDMSSNPTQQSQSSDENAPSIGATDTEGSKHHQTTASVMATEDLIASQASDMSAYSTTESQNEAATEESSSQADDSTRKLISLHETHAQSSHDSVVPEDVPMPTFYSDMVAKYETKVLSASPFVKFAQPYLLMNARAQERRLVHLKRLRDQDIIEERGDEEKPKPRKFQLIKPEMVHQIGQKAPRHIMEVLHAVHDAEYDKALYNYKTQTRSWENYIQGNLDLFDPYAHQNIVVLHSVICTETKIPCVEPQLIALGFYDEHSDRNASMDPDCTLGQYLEDVCYGAESTCTANGCDRKMCEHHRTYVHGEARITVFIESGTSDKSREEGITMWSYCKICKRETREMEMSRFTWKYSFGKYLELSFWSRGTHLVRDESLGGWNCPHDHHRDHIRYFGLDDKIVRVHYDPIDPLEIIVPRARITWKVEHDLNMKNSILAHCQDRWTRFTASVKARLKAIKLDKIVPEKAESCKAEIERLTKKIQDEHTSLIRKLQDKYINSRYYEVIPFNIVLREMLVMVGDWDAAFSQFEADFLPSDKDIRRLTMNQLRKMFTDDLKESLASTEASAEGIELSEKTSQQAIAEVDSREGTQSTNTSSENSQSEALQPEGVDARVVTSQEATLISAPDTILERIEPLDLATSKSSNQNILSLDQARESIPATPAPNTSSAVAPGDTPDTPFTSLPTPTSPTTKTPPVSVAEQVERLRRKQHAVQIENANRALTKDGTQSGTSTTPAKANIDHGSSRRMGLNVSPPMIRAISQPATTLPTLPRVGSAVGKKTFSIAKDKERVTPMDAPAGHELRKPSTNESIKSDKKLFGGLKQHRKGNQSNIPRFVGKRDSRVSTIRKHFEQLSREFEKEREKDRKKRAANVTHSRPFLQHSRTRATVEVYQDVADAVKEPVPVEDDKSTKGPAESKAPETVAPDSLSPDNAQQPQQSDATAAPSTEAPQEEGIEAEKDESVPNNSLVTTDDERDSDTENSIIDGSTLEEIADSLDSNTEIPLELPKHDRTNFMKALSNFWNEQSASQWPPLDYPLNASDHIFIDSDIIVREYEPSSVIAFALSSEDYKNKLRRFHRRKASQPNKSTVDIEELGDKDLGVDDYVSNERLETSLVHNSSSHYKYQFAEGSAKMLVKIFYAEQFDALRRKCGVADRIIECLSRCVPWDSKGGKTKSVFLKTQDDRLVMKSLSQIETQAFLKFAPAYFKLMAEALFHELPSVIAKMLGFFQVVIKNPVTNTDIKLDLLLMENLFYDREATRIFDLKGSMRNRKIQSTGEQNEVLLDENMVEYIYESPLFAREHSKRLLSASVFNDTLFLARQDVMDYSLMIAVDEKRKELVVGIIDCIRTYTWDKKLESWIKDRGFAGGGRNRPTVTSPKEYKSRFREAMARYILQAPNCWHQFNPSAGLGRQRVDAVEDALNDRD
ncbi:hypothetical protein F4808DRAFT_20265 [Astrocystis sublimbata]|nr:hypothetical protein F4808DRAFT_20265 [Astrocystis sublimbata]